MSRLRTGHVGLWLLVLVQIALPLSYYAGCREPDDERFAWRMFSAVRARTCTVSVAPERAGAAAQPAEPITDLHSSWIRALERGRSAVIARYLRQRCGGAAPPLRLDRQCSDALGVALAPEVYRYDCRRERLAIDGLGVPHEDVR